jgi:uncharacterized protein YbjT (DUF2867 family)
MKIVVLGGGGGIGRHVVRLATEQGHQVVAVARSPLELPDGARQLTGDATDPGVVAQAVEGVGPGTGAVVSCLGVTKRSTGRPSAEAARALVAALPARSRVVAVGGAGVDAPGDAKGLGLRLASALTRRLGVALVEDKQQEHDVYAASDLAWTVVRLPRLIDGEATTPARTTDRAPGLTASPVRRADVAATMLALVTDGGHERQAPFVVR